MNGLASPASFSWYPGHMLKAEKAIREKLPLIDLAIEVVDARAPLSTRNYNLERRGRVLARMIVMAKTDLADPKVTQTWLRHFQAQGIGCVQMDRFSQRSRLATIQALTRAARATIESARQRRRSHTISRAMVLGVPNVGKSTLINIIAGQRRATTGPVPGVTRGQQWIAVNEELELLDTPGVMLPRIANEETALKLGALSVIKDSLLDFTAVFDYLVQHLDLITSGVLAARYRIDNETRDVADILEKIGRDRGFLRAGGEVDREKAAVQIVKEFREGTLGRFSLEQPP